MFCQVKEAPFFKTTLIKSPSGKYFALRIVAHNDSGLSTRRHACFANKARLKQCISRKPILFGLLEHTTSTMPSLFWLSSSPHQNCAITSMIPLQIFLGILKTDIDTIINMLPVHQNFRKQMSGCLWAFWCTTLEMPLGGRVSPWSGFSAQNCPRAYEVVSLEIPLFSQEEKKN